MLFGNREAIGIEIEPRAPTWERRYPAEVTAWAALQIWVRGINLCEHIAEGTNQIEHAVNVPLAPLADWFIRSWAHVRFEEHPREYAGSDEPHENLRLWAEMPPASGYDEDPWLESRERWWAMHFLLAGSEGAFLPNLAFARSHDVVVCEWAPPKSSLRGTPDWIRAGGKRIVAWEALEEAVAAFVRYIAEWLRREGQNAVYPWVALEHPLQRRATPRDLELLTGHTVEELSRVLEVTNEAELQRSLGLTAGGDPSASPVTQALRDLPVSLDRSIADPLAWLRESTSQPVPKKVWTLRAVAVDAARIASGEVEEGYEAAAAVRRALGLNGEPLLDVPKLCSGLGIKCEEFETRLEDGHMVVGARENGGVAAAVLRSNRTEADWVRRFEWARALGHIVLDSFRVGAMGAASSLHTLGYRRRRSGAFAAELLLPREALTSATGGVLDVASTGDIFARLMRRFGTGATTTAQHLYNRRLLSSTALRDDLIERYAAQN